MANEKRGKEKMEAMSHFCHEEHPLKLIENSEMVKGVHCRRCQEPILGGSVYSCISCPYFLHKTCAELQPTLHYVHHPHPLKLVARKVNWICDVCLNDYKSGKSAYRCSVCDFNACLNCGVANAALKEKALVKIQEEGQHAFLHHHAHREHPLLLIVWETIIGIIGVDFGNNEEKLKGAVVGCAFCEEPLSIGDSAYACTQCRFFLHKLCSQLPYTINLPSLYQHPLKLLKVKDFSVASCYVCKKIMTGRFAYGINKDAGTHFNACSNCFLVEFACKAKADAIKEEAKIKIEHKGHPKHPLTLKSRPGSFHCDACNEKDEGLFYECDPCDFWIHKSCATLAPTIHLPHQHHKHPLVLVYSLPENFYKYPFYCIFCDQYIRRNEWLYHCANCRYFAHIKCALNAQQQPSTSRDNPSTSAASDNEISLLHFPMSEAFTDPLKLPIIHSKIIAQDDKETTEINHWSHPAHSLVLNVEDPQGNNKMPDINSGDPIKVCYACVQPLSYPYYSCIEHGCSVFTDLHKYCAHLPRTLQHQLHPDHTLHLVDTWEKFYECTGCYSRGNTFAYKCKMNCKFCLCVNCSFLPITIKHESHNHPITQLIKLEVVCNGCACCHRGISYACNACDFQLGMYCAMRSPKSLAHRYCKGHEIPLTYPPVDDHPEDFYCDICEEEMNPNFPLYHCHNHKSRSSFHLYCISRPDWYANIWAKGTETPSYHKHPLTYVRRKKTPKYVCSVCNQDINGFLVLECRAKTCNFIICYDCDMNKEW